MTINCFKKDFSYAYAGVGGGWILTITGSEYSRPASLDERKALDDHYESLPIRRRTKCQGLPYLIF